MIILPVPILADFGATLITMLIVSAISIGISYALRPKTKSNRLNPASEFEFPTAEQGRPIPVLFGTRRITAPNVVWYGDISATAIRK